MIEINGIAQSQTPVLPVARENDQLQESNDRNRPSAVSNEAVDSITLSEEALQLNSAVSSPEPSEQNSTDQPPQDNGDGSQGETVPQFLDIRV